MNLIRLLVAQSEIPARKLVFLAFLAGLSSALVLITINAATAVEVSTYRRLQLFFMFLVALAAYVVSHHYILRRATAEVEQCLHRLRNQFSERIRHSRLRALEQFNKADLMAAANKDTYTISQAAYPLINACQSLLLVVVTCFYIGYLSLTALVAGILLTAVCVPIHLAQVKRLHEAMKESTSIESSLFGIQSDFLQGAKEMRLHKARSRALSNRFQERSQKAADLRAEQRTRFASVYVFSQVGFYLLLATMVFMAPQIAEADQKTVIATAMAVLFILGPISTVLGGIPILANANAAALNLEKIEDRLKQGEEELEESDREHHRQFHSLHYSDIVFSYDNGSKFQLGPLSLTLKPGELFFLTGGNGSGKSTLAKVLGGLYLPDRGKVVWDDKKVRGSQVAEFRSLFSSVFSDFHLFDELYGLEADPDEVEELLEQFGLAGKTKYREGRFDTLELSTGQRKRLALVVAMLEKRPILLLDEWAAEQDPDFREHFYRSILPQLREEGKCVVVVTHDDRYFQMADHLVKLEEGKISDRGESS